jgi:TonB family protein
VLTLLFWPQAARSKTKELGEAEARGLAISRPRPAYPYEARAKREMGSGVAILTVDTPSGHVINAVMAPSTGSKLLDQAALSAFREWRFQPGIVSKVRIPITFTLTGVTYRRVVVTEKKLEMGAVLSPFLGKYNVVKAPIPHYPPWREWTWKQGRGVYEIHVDKEGTVTEVKILKPSGDQIFDEVVIKTLRKWRLRTGPKIIELPLAFTLTPDSFRVRIP